MSPITGISEEPLGTGRLFAPSPPDSGELFATEVDQAIARQGGERSIESRQDAVRSRRETRRGSFEGQRASEARVAGESERGEDAVIDEGTSPLAEGSNPLQEKPAEMGGLRPVLSKEGVEAAGTSGTSSNATSGVPAGAATDVTAAPPVDTAQLVRLASSQGGQGGQAAQGARNAAAQPLTAVGDARAEATTQAFLDGARGSTAKGSTRTAAGAGQPMSDPELIDRANEIMRQIRMHMAPGATQITLNLEPAELGKLWIRMSLRGGKLAAHVRAERQETLDALAPKLAELRELLGEQGVEADTIELELGFREESPDSPLESFEGGSSRPEHKPTNPLRTQPLDVPSPSARGILPGADGIDTYA